MGCGCGRKVAVPRFGEIGKAKTFPLLLLNPLIVAGTNVKVLQDISETVGIERFAFAVAAPRPTVEIIEMFQKFRGEDLLLTSSDEKFANVCEQLGAGREIFSSVNVKDPMQGQTRSSGPFAAEGVGDGKQRQGTFALAHGKPGKISEEQVSGMLEQGALIVLVLNPAADLLYQRPARRTDDAGAERNRLLGALAALEHYGNGAIGQRRRQTAGAGKSLGAEDVLVFAGGAADGIQAVFGRAGIKKADDGLSLSRTKGGLPVIKQQSGTALGDALHETRGSEAAAG